jgi:hypothetical protein
MERLLDAKNFAHRDAGSAGDAPRHLAPIPVSISRTGRRIFLMKIVDNTPTTVLCNNKLKYAGQNMTRYRVPFERNSYLQGDHSLTLRAAPVPQDLNPGDQYNQAVFSVLDRCGEIDPSTQPSRKLASLSKETARLGPATQDFRLFPWIRSDV